MKVPTRISVRLRHPVLLMAGTGLSLFLSPVPGWAATKVDYNRDIRPILSENCFACHGPDANKRKAGLRLDERESAVTALDSGAVAVVPGNPEQSALMYRLTSADPDEVMPPPETGKKLTPAQVEQLRLWIREGAEWQPHWAFRSLQDTAVPDLDDPVFVRNDIDRFILERLRREGLEPSPVADPLTLVRRLSFDLTGLPPDLGEVQAFGKDPSPEHYERLVDAYLASEAYGERMAMYWLDQVRYADTCGYHGDQHVDVALYRDYVIDSFNRNLPFDRFTREQLAGDLLPEATMEQKVASGYNRLLMTTEEGGAQPKEYQAKYAADRVRNVSSVWMGATMGCAECHDHKYDPYSMRDFYSLASFFADINEKAVGRQDPTKIPTEKDKARIKALEQEMEPLQQERDTQTPPLDRAQAAWEKRQWHWITLPLEEARSTNGAFLTFLEDESILALGDNPEEETYTLSLATDLEGITAFRLEVLPDESLPNDGPGRYDNGNFVLSEFEVHAGESKVEWERALATFAQDKFPVANAIDGKPDTGWAIGDKNGQVQHAIFQAKTNLAGASKLTILLRHHHGTRHALGRFRLSASTTVPPDEDSGPQPLPVEMADILARPPDQRSAEHQAKLSAHYRGFAPLLEPVRQQISRIQGEIDAVNKGVAQTLITTTVPPREMRILPRGNWLSDDGQVVQPAVPAFLGKVEVEEGRANRLDLANWLVSRENPLVARVFVNRLWKLMFGRGLVKTLDDFGSQGTPPTHPELLDWLADEFVSSGWDVKHMVRLIALSGAYRQSSQATEAERLRDPYNDLFARQGRFRLEAEMVRDNALAVSALLAPRVGGPSVKPYQPARYWEHLNFPKREYEPSEGDDLYRRSLYTYWCRTFLHPSLAAFDAPTREECTVERVRSNTPQQALVLLNDPIYVEASRVLAELIIRAGGKNPRQKIGYAMRKVLARPPTADERALLLDLYRKHLAEYKAAPADAESLLEEGEWPLLKDISRPEMAAWTSVSRVLLNLHETITRR